MRLTPSRSGLRFTPNTTSDWMRSGTFILALHPAELALSRKAQQSAGQPPRYAGTCAHLNETERRARWERGLQPTLRFRVPPGRTVEFTDLVRGPQRFASDHIGDFVIRRADGGAQFFFVNAVDDAPSWELPMCYAAKTI